jgi:hypothetical protein
MPKPQEPSTALVNLREKLQALVAQTKKAESPSGGYISLAKGRMTIGTVGLPGDKIVAIVIDYRKDNEFYESAYVPGESQAPVCAAVVAPDEVLTPWRAVREGEDITKLLHHDKELGLVTDVAKPQVPAGMVCDSCPMLEWGSAALIKGQRGSGKGKACRESRRLHILAADQCTTPADIERAPFMTMIPPPTSLENFRVFANSVADVLGKPIFGAVVEISVVPHDQYQFQVHYKILDAINDEGLLFALLQRHEQIRAKPIILPKGSDDAATKDARGTRF